ncbi:hypothetical protein OPKNFCMD_4207 [Methylobacterium crusticola]|uniref:DUF4174 domain-containing protein n=1 Tax=Methylobacterium crusticola TaxID=1697972 RepID=A0ABQ4R1M6_9HYPH|nr:DUF4174 domain-containing protein [Methylobacterium crusticola]GJD51453.1 hypothetical protein OPKNFCMD_4207 [Methylobacterium crusticola]
MPLPTLMAAALLAAAGPALPAGAESRLDRYRWSARVLVVAAAPDDPHLAAQRRILAAARAEARERDLVVLEAVGAGAEAAALRRRLGLPPAGFRAVLVGKDGGAKLVSAEPLTAGRLLSTIDAMPMRREEAGRRRP